MNRQIRVWKPELERYTGLVQQIKEKSKERKTLVAEKKGIANIPCEAPQGTGCPHYRADGRTGRNCVLKRHFLQKFEYAEDAGAEIGPGAYRLNDLNAIHIRQAQIQQDDFRIVRCGLHNGCRAIGRHHITIIICFQYGCNEISYRWVILNH